MLLDLPPALEITEATAGADALAAALRARRFARAVVRPAALALDRRLASEHDHFAWDLVRAAAAEGWLSAFLPAFAGGGGLGITAMSLVMEELCAADAGVGNVIGAHGLGLLPLMLAGDLDVALPVFEHVIRAERSGAPVLCAFAITEPGGGSDVEEREGLAKGDVRTRARRVPGGYRIAGRKVFISNGSVAEHVVVFAGLDPSAPAPSWTAFLVQRGDAGWRCARVEHKLGQRACPAAELVFDDVFVPARRRIGPEGGGWELTRRTLAVSRGPVGSVAVGIARDAFEAALGWVQAARARGLAAARAPWIDDALARMAIAVRTGRAAALEAARHCDEALLPSPAALRAIALAGRAPAGLGRALLRAAAARIADDPGTGEAWSHQAVLAATAKVAASDAAMTVTTTALDLVPPDAGEPRARAEKAFRDAKLTQIYEGTNQINLRAIAHESWGRRGS